MTDRLRQNEESAEQARQLLEAHRTAGEMLEERMSRTEASVRDTSPAGGVLVRPGRKRHLELTMDDSDLERLRRDTNQRTSVAKTLDGVIGPGCFVPGQDGFNEDECKKSSEARPGDEGTVTELDLRLDDCASAELKSVAADFYHALILFYKKIEKCLDQQRGKRI